MKDGMTNRNVWVKLPNGDYILKHKSTGYTKMVLHSQKGSPNFHISNRKSISLPKELAGKRIKLIIKVVE